MPLFHASLLLVAVPLVALPAHAGPYAGSRILGGNGVCIVWSESPERTDTDFGITHYYSGNYVNDWIRAGYPEFLIGGEWESARGTASRRRPRSELRLRGENLSTLTEFRSLTVPALEVKYRVYATMSGTLVLDIQILNEGAAAHEIAIRPVVRFRREPFSIEPMTAGGNTALVASFEGEQIAYAFAGDGNISSVSAAGGELVSRMIVSPNTAVRATIMLWPQSAPHAGAGDVMGFAFPERFDFESARAEWQEWLRGGSYPSLADSALRMAYEAALTATAATNLRGNVPADMTGQFVTDDRPQLYPRDALMTARVLAEAGYSDAAAQIVEFWNERIPQKSPGEWFARYDALGKATSGGSGAPYDLPEWDSNGYYASMMLLLYQKTGRWYGDHMLMQRLLDFIVDHQDAHGLVTEGGIVEWEGLLPASNMSLAAGLRAGAIMAEIGEEPEAAARFRAAARRMEKGIARLFSRDHGAYMDFRNGRPLFNTSANFGFIWGYPDHFELQATNAWYREHATKLDRGVQYFDMAGYGSDLFGFTTGAAAQYHALAGDPDRGFEHTQWMTAHANIYEMMPERVYLGGHDVSPASPLSWCNAEFAAGLLELARSGDPRVCGTMEYPLWHLGEECAGLDRVVRELGGVSKAGKSAPLLRAALAKCAAPGSIEERLAAFRGALTEIRRIMSRGREPWLEDLDGIVSRLESRLDRIIATHAQAAIRVETGPIVLPIGRRSSIEIGLESSPGNLWTSVSIESMDGNVRRVTRRVPMKSAAAARVTLPLEFSQSRPAYASAVVIAAQGTWRGIPYSMRRAVPVRVVEPFAIDVADEERPGDDAVRVNIVPRDAGRWQAEVKAPRGWRVELSRRSRERSEVVLVPRPGLKPGHYTFRVSPANAPRTVQTFTIPYHATINLEGRWMFRRGDDARWSGVISDEGWTGIDVPKNWEAAGHPDYDGHAWYRTGAVIPKDWSGHDLEIVIGAIDDQDWTYFNGTEIGHQVTWNEERRYRIPAKLVRFGESNTLAVRVYDSLFGGGIWKGPVTVGIGR